MPNDVKLQEGHPVDENLRPLKVGGKSTALETAQWGDGAKVNGDLIIDGNVKGKGNMKLSGGVFSCSGVTAGIVKTNDLQNDGGELDIASSDNILLDADDDIILDSADGNFIYKNNGTEFSPADSAYAGMILGYTVIGLDETPAGFDVTNAMLPVHDDLKVSFVFPPSGKVEIMASIYVQTDSARPLTFGLSTTNNTTGFTTLGAKYENHTYMSDETDGEQHQHMWYVTGTPGDAEELWFAAGCTFTNRYDLYWGGDSSSVADNSHPMEYQPFIMKATALPATIYTG